MILFRDGYAPYSVDSVLRGITPLVTIGYVEKREKQYFLSAAGRAALGVIEKHVKEAIPDKMLL